jgi:Ca2+-transporting ATPase
MMGQGAKGTAGIGLTSDVAAQILQSDGPNEIARAARKPVWKVFIAQFRSALVALLFVACVVSAALGEAADAIAIAVIVVVNACVGFFQEYRAERALFALRALTAPRARVIRDRHVIDVPARDVVIGDLLALEAGDIVAADARLEQAHALLTAEALLTGESAPVTKQTNAVDEKAPLAERVDTVFAGTSVAGGTASARVIATGMGTELGKIASLLSSTEEAETPLTKSLERVGRQLLLASIVIVALVALVGALRGMPWLDILMSAVSLAVAAVPEGLAAIVTIALALGVQRMAKRNVLIRKLPAVETLGSASVICTDKTGTLTTGTMAVRELWGQDHHALLDAAAACSDAELGRDGRADIGDPTELALLRAAFERGIERDAIETSRPRRTVRPFDADTKRMSIERADGILYVKGALESLLPLCSAVPEGAEEATREMASRGLRVLAVATGQGAAESELHLRGLVAMADPPRTEAAEAVAVARAAGIRTVMITGDHPVTARAIASELGILKAGENADEIVHARATPEDKLRIVRAWKARGAVVAMTGDGVNDAPALREAHIGIAMGKGGTEVTREAAGMVLSDDNFASIVAAVREGRAIFDNIQKTLVYLLAGNAAELAIMLLASMAGLPLPLTPLQLLWINLATDGAPALALVADPPEGDVMQRQPRPAKAPILGAREWRTILFVGALQTVVVLSVFVVVLRQEDLQAARNMAFTTLVFGELFRAFSARSRSRPFWRTAPQSNVFLLAVVGVSALVQIGMHHIPLTQRLFDIGGISLRDCLMSLALGLLPMLVIELWKVIRWRVPGHAERAMMAS